MIRVATTALLTCLAAPAPACNVALALAIDVSGSVDAAEFSLQMNGLADALRDGLVADALVSEQAMVTLVQWSGKSRQRVSIPWRAISSAEDAEVLAAEVETVGRSWRNFSTGIGEVMAFSANLFAQVPQCKRKVIDISGDGKSNEGAPPEDIREALAFAGFQINGLAIETDEAELAEYYRDFVMAGDGSFVISATGFEDYPEKIRKKLIREVTKTIALK
ncbi:MAG: DUF1194 domain-containing protein [Pseudomonadota bacterium]